MSRVRYIKIPGANATLTAEELAGAPPRELEERADGSRLNQNTGDDHATQGRPLARGPFSTPGRKLAFLAAAIGLVLIFSAAIWLLQMRASGTGAIAVGTSYPITNAGADITGLGTGPKVGQL